MKDFLSSDVKITRVMNAVAAGTSDQNGTGVDMSGFDGVMFVASFGTLTATQVTSLKAQGSSDDGSSDTYADLTGTLVGPMDDDDDNKVLVLDVQQPKERYIRPVINRATANAVIDGIVAIQYKARDVPVTQGSTVSGVERHLAPAEGTA